MAETQRHGFDFEDWIKATFFEQYNQPGYTDKWDAVNVTFKSKFNRFSASLSGLPVSIKTCKYGSSIGFGDAIRQFENTSDFILFVGFWSILGSGKKVVAAKAVKIDSQSWHQLFEKTVTLHELKKDELGVGSVAEKLNQLDSTIKNTFHYRVARNKAREEKKSFPAMDITLNPKIDSKNQRRLQCSLPSQIFWKLFAKESPSFSPNCTLWGEEIPVLK